MDGNARSKRRLNRSNDSNHNGSYSSDSTNDIAYLQDKGKELESILFDGSNTQMSLFIDPVALGFGKGLSDNHFAARSNDCRLNMYDDTMSKDDKKRLNCKFVTVLINRWPSVFLVTIKNVKKGQQLWSDYGDKYSDIFDESKQFEKKKRETEEHLKNVNVVAKDVNVQARLNDNKETYVLEL